MEGTSDAFAAIWRKNRIAREILFLHISRNAKYISFDGLEQTNVMGTLNVNRLAVGLMAQNEPDAKKFRGVIVNTAGIEGIRGTTGQVSTAAASGAIIGEIIWICVVASMGNRCVERIPSHP